MIIVHTMKALICMLHGRCPHYDKAPMLHDHCLHYDKAPMLHDHCLHYDKAPIYVYAV